MNRQPGCHSGVESQCGKIGNPLFGRLFVIELFDGLAYIAIFDGPDDAIAQGAKRLFNLGPGCVAALIVPAFDGPLVILPEPGKDFAFPAIGREEAVRVEPLGAQIV